MSCFWDDDFSGIDGSAPSTDKWLNTSESPGTIQIYGNKLRMDNGPTGITGAGHVILKAAIEGDFDVQVGVTGIVHPSVNGWDGRLQFKIDSTHYIWISYWANVLYKRWQVGCATGGSEFYPAYSSRTVEYGSLRISRSGSNTSVYYQDTGSWTLKSTQEIGAGIGEIHLATVKWSDNPNAIVDFDNFMFNSGCPPSPLRRTGKLKLSVGMGI